MMQSLITMSIMISLIFMFTKHPLSMGLALILQTIMVAMMTGLMIKNFWFSYILLITMLSGALVLFIYMASIASNEKFYTSIKLLLLIAMMTITAIVWPIIKTMVNKQDDMIESFNYLIDNNQLNSLIKLFNLHNMMITITIISYLFLTMIVISYIVNVFEGPLRMKN